MPIARKNEPNQQKQAYNQDKGYSPNNLEGLTTDDLHHEFSGIQEVNRFLEEEYDEFIREYLNRHGLDIQKIPEDMTVEYDPSGKKTKGGRAIRFPQYIALGPDIGHTPLESSIGEEYIHEFGANHFIDLDEEIRSEIEEVITKQWNLYCSGTMADFHERQDSLENAESWYNSAESSDIYRPGAGTRIRETAEEYLQRFDNSSLTEEEYIRQILSSPDKVANDYLNKYSKAATHHPSEQPYHQR